MSKSVRARARLGANVGARLRARAGARGGSRGESSRSLVMNIAYDIVIVKYKNETCPRVGLNYWLFGLQPGILALNIVPRFTEWFFCTHFFYVFV